MIICILVSTQYSLGTVTSEEVEKVMSIPTPSTTSKYIKLAFRIGFWSLTAYGVYRVIQKVSSKEIVTKLLK